MDLDHFVSAQQETYRAALAELGAGAKRTHWMWFIFPQLRGLGSSPMAQHYAIADLAEARAYLAHPLLRPRLVEVTQAVLTHRATPLRTIFGSPDDLKFRSSMTLFERAAAGEEDIFSEALDVLCSRTRDERTLQLLAQG